MTDNIDDKEELPNIEAAEQAEKIIVNEDDLTKNEEQTEVVLEEDQIQVLEGRLLRLRADFDNFRKRTDRDKENWSRMALEKLINDIIPVVDHFDLGLQNAAQHEAKAAVREGFQMVYEQLNGTLKKHGVETINAVGEPFNPAVHEALTYAPSDEVAQEHVVFEQSKGYMLGDKLIRAAKVVVSSGPAEGAV